MVDVGLAHGDECFDVAEAGRRCMGFEADPLHAEAIRQKAVLHPNSSLLSITAAAAGDTLGFVTFSADRHNKHGVGGTLSSRLDAQTGKPISGWDAVKVRMVRLDAVVPQAASVFLLKSDTQGHELAVLRGAEGLFRVSQRTHTR